MSRKGILIVAALFGVAFLLLALASRGYRRFEAMQSMEKAMAAVRREFPDARPISGSNLATALKGPVPPLLIDVRSSGEFAASRLSGAIHQPDPRMVAELAEGTSHVVVYDSAGFRSAEVAETADEFGTGRVSFLEGGIFQWTIEGRPLVDAAGNPTDKVHPHNRYWGRLLAPERRAE
jgi:rhodanese-related sulfurtransferase